MVQVKEIPDVPGVVFDYQPRTRLVFGSGSGMRVGELAAELAGRHALLVTDKGIESAGHADRVEQSLVEAGLKVSRFAEVIENPTESCVEKCKSFAHAAGIDLIVGLGGGSSMDTAKGCNFLLTNGGRMEDYWGVGKATKPMLPLIAIPTTAGTGSECQCAALITREDTHQKMACLDSKAAARIAILDPELTLSQPQRVAARTGADAIAHALETAVTTKRNPISDAFSRQAYRLLVRAFPKVLNSTDDIEARGDMLLGAAFAGTAIENSMLGAAHAAANPLTARFGIVHGDAVGLMLPHVIQFNSAEKPAADRYLELSEAGEPLSSNGSPALLKNIRNLLQQAGIPRSLDECGVREESLEALAGEAADQWTAQFNPRSVEKEDFMRLYEAAFARNG